MRRSRLREFLHWLPLLTALGLSLAMLAFTALLALTAPHDGIPALEPPRRRQPPAPS